MFGIQLLQMFQRKRGTRAVAQQTFQPCPVILPDAHRRIHGKSADVDS
jgi:hypothetical protein